MQCPRCLNTDEAFFFYGSKGWMCRRCIRFKRICLEEKLNIRHEEPPVIEGEVLLAYPLTERQKKISACCKEQIDKTDILIHAVTGAGKTEMVIGVIEKCLRERKRCCFAIARRQVVLQISKRLSAIFPYAKVTPICQGYTEDISGDILVVTTHQLYRFYQEFDVLILDEPDAFPFKGSEVLHGIAKTSCKGHVLYLTATPDKELEKKVREKECIELQLFKRPHGHDLIVPETVVGAAPILWIRLALWLGEEKRRNRQAIIFVPSIRLMERTAFILKRVFRCCAICSKSANKEEILDRFIAKETDFCVATTILERGITIEGIDVAVLYADDPVFDEAALVQMIGRVGRSIRSYDGRGLFLSRKASKEVKRCVKRIIRANEAP